MVQDRGIVKMEYWHQYSDFQWPWKSL